MREIKFRGKRGDNGGWVYGYYFFNGTDYGIVNSKIFPGSWQAVIPETVGQFTGLTDKEGKEIYEGDILKEYSVLEDEKPRIIHIIWCDGGFMYRNSFNSDFYTYQSHCNRCEIIGNIHDNPELLN